MNNYPNPGREPPVETARKVARIFFGVGSDKFSQQKAIRQLLVQAILFAVLVPLLFYLNFGEVGPLGWGMTIFFVVYCLLAAVGIFFLPRPEYHSPVTPRGDWADRLGAFWLVSCAFGPFFGWILTSALPLTVVSWRWVYGMRVLTGCRTTADYRPSAHSLPARQGRVGGFTHLADRHHAAHLERGQCQP